MNQLTDSTSDTDSNSSTSWVFVDESTSENKSEVNKYYLNCSSEPVQELTEKCLNSAGSEIETDSDGFSVISESDSDKRVLRSDEVEKEIFETANVVTQPVNDDSIFGYVIFAGVVLFALLLPLFLSDDNSLIDRETESRFLYASKAIPDEGPDYKSISKLLEDHKESKGKHKNRKYYDKEIEKRRKQLKELEDLLEIELLEIELLEKERALKNLKKTILKKQKPKKNNKETGRRNGTGDWYNNLHNGRNEIRKRQQMANWIFDRAVMRNKKRDKAVWYFNWMTDREQLRFKRTFKPFAY